MPVTMLGLESSFPQRPVLCYCLGSHCLAPSLVKMHYVREFITRSPHPRPDTHGLTASHTPHILSPGVETF